MKPSELVALGKARHGEQWIRLLSAELGFHFTTIWRAARGTKPVSREIQQAIQLCQLHNQPQGEE